MSRSTFEPDGCECRLETFEWDDVWWEHTENTTAKRVAYIGDSISRGTRHIATELSDNTILFDGFGTSKALDNPYFKESLLLFLKQESPINALLFNNGLHGWHLSDSEYEAEYRKMLLFLKGVSTAPIFLVLSTHLPADEDRNAAVITRNEIALKLAGEFGLTCIDLYAASESHTDLYSPDNVHFTKEGYAVLAKCILSKLEENGI